MTSSRRVLVVGHTIPWPEVSGTRMRLANVLRGLAGLGEIDLFVLTNQEERTATGVPSDLPIRRFEVAARPAKGFSLATRLAWLVGGRLPSDLVGRDYRKLQARFAAWARSDYDLVWFSRIESSLMLRPFISAPTVVDLDDLEEYKIAGYLAASVAQSGGGLRGRVRRWAAPIVRAQGARNMRLWRQVRMETTRAAGAVVVCSEEDRLRVGAPNAAVIPNGYPFQERPVGKVTVGRPPVVAFPGFHLYPPNADAASFLARMVGPLLRIRVPGAQIRVIGAADRRVLPLHDPPRVIVTGHVDRMVDELTGADVIAVPIRFGSGTRIKILEAFAHKIPVVSTRPGAEGLEVGDGRELLLADTPEAFAEACARLLTDQECRARLADAAHTLFAERYRWDHIHPRIAALGAAVAASHGWTVEGALSHGAV
jgi:hypothetical protein